MANPRIGLLGGSFNPPHFGHLNLAIALQEQLSLSEVWVIPAHHSPFRLAETMPTPEHRLNMVSLAFGGIAGFKILDDEVRRPPPSYTIDTISALQQRYPQHAFCLLLSEDVLARFGEWKCAEEIKARVTVCAGRRSVYMRGEGIPIPVMEVSATRVRDRLKKGLYCGHLVPAKVLDYIIENQLYSDL